MERELWVGAVVWLVEAVHREGERKVRDELTCAHDAPVRRRGGLGPAFSTSAWSGGRPPLRTPGGRVGRTPTDPMAGAPISPESSLEGGEPSPPIPGERSPPPQRGAGAGGGRRRRRAGRRGRWRGSSGGPPGPCAREGGGGGGLVGQAYRGDPHAWRVSKVGSPRKAPGSSDLEDVGGGNGRTG